MTRTGANLRSLLVPLLFTACATIDPGGSGTETTTGIIGAIVNDQGKPQAHVQVQLIPDTYDPVLNDVTIPVDTTDSLGRYAFRDIDSGDYSVQAVHLTDGTRALISGIHAALDTIVTATDDTLQPPGAVRVIIDASHGYLYIPGTTFYVFFNDTSGYALLDSVPAGTIPSLCYSSTERKTFIVIEENVNVLPGDTVTIAFQDWAYSRRLIINTSVSGAGVQGNVYGFPVLVRLDGDNFDFSQAETDGADIRFTTAGGAPLAYEIERWDRVAELTEVWVKVDTVYGNDSVQSITMYWGNPAAIDLSSSAAVFDTADGFQGVWHLGDLSGDSVHDATPNRYHGVSPDTARPQVAEGVVGNCGTFDGVADFITMPNTAAGKLDFPERGDYSIYAWVYLDTFDNVPRPIVAKGEAQYCLQLVAFSDNLPIWEFVEFGATGNWQVSTSPSTGREWTLLMGVRQGNKQLLYCNGVLVDSVANEWPQTFPRNTSNDLSIGRFLNVLAFPTDDEFSFFKGSIDEVRIMDEAQTLDWARLCYMNQRPDDRLVMFR